MSDSSRYHQLHEQAEGPGGRVVKLWGEVEPSLYEEAPHVSIEMVKSPLQVKAEAEGEPDRYGADEASRPQPSPFFVGKDDAGNERWRRPAAREG